MDRKEMEERAMMRYSAITPLLHANVDEKAPMKRLLNEQAAKLWPLPDCQ